jgi:hypothetical protein
MMGILLAQGAFTTSKNLGLPLPGSRSFVSDAFMVLFLSPAGTPWMLTNQSSRY